MKKTLLFFIAICAIIFKVQAQKLSPVEEFEAKWMHQTIPAALFPQKDINNKAIVMKDANMLILGFYSCIPCRVQMPHIIKYAQKHPDLHFIYLTYDDKATILKEMDATSYSPDMKNFSIVSIEKSLLDQTGLAGFGYPMKYFLDENFKINQIDSYTDLRTTQEEMFKRWDMMFEQTNSITEK